MYTVLKILCLISLFAFVYFWWEQNSMKKSLDVDFEMDEKYIATSKAKRFYLMLFVASSAMLLIFFAPDKSQTTTQTQKSNPPAVEKSQSQQTQQIQNPSIPQLPEQISASPGLGSTRKAWESIHQRNTQYSSTDIYDGERFVLTIFGDRIHVISHQADVAKDQFSAQLIASMCPSDMNIVDKKSHSDKFHRIERYTCTSELLRSIMPESNGNFEIEIHFDIKTNQFLLSTISVTR